MTAKVLTVALVCLLAWPVIAAPAPAPTTASAPATQPRPATRPAARATPDPLILGSRSGDDAGDMLRRMMAYTLVILVLGGLALLVVKKVLPKLGATQGRNIAVLETVYLGPKKSLHLLRVGTRRFLVAGSRDEVSLLGEVTSAFPDGDEQPPVETGKGASFLSILKGKDVGPAATDKS